MSLWKNCKSQRFKISVKIPDIYETKIDSFYPNEQFHVNDWKGKNKNGGGKLLNIKDVTIAKRIECLAENSQKISLELTISNNIKCYVIFAYREPSSKI